MQNSSREHRLVVGTQSFCNVLHEMIVHLFNLLLGLIMSKVILGEPGCSLQYNACDKIVANVLYFILDKMYDFKVNVKNIYFACLTLVSHYESITTM